jgi:hypothetical protein
MGTREGDGTARTAGFSASERAAMEQRAAELRAEATGGGRGSRAAKDEAAVLEKIAGMPDADRALAERVHAMVAAAAPDLAPKLYYGQPAYASGKEVVCFFRSGRDDGERYATFGFAAEANLDDASGLWPTSYALADRVSDDAWAELAQLVERAVS